ncbi:RNA polymerase sigma factor [Aquibacillus koreensis]|uniref:RNA polymerase sigma factor n=1 Tax=Aquibacillus koreensis TaxID=279446 RepID=A0A9X3WSX6_9BACI|nr:RNA polymerase sigma factor [Aquibacillus koreensis]MCT2535309.1 RNA polymerase sigma factor [Aquibacillus koreensis]MDC3422849.1 RNA polymerase sigma factor [Aquibacillus koreensis]
MLVEFDEHALYETYFEKVYKVTYYILKNEELAKDATHDRFIKVFKNLGKINKQSKVNAWITTIATRTAIDIYNKNKKQSTQEFKDENYGSDANMFDFEMHELVNYLEHIPPEHKQVLVLKYVEDLTEKEIAKLLSNKVGTVKSRIFRAKERLYEQYKIGGDQYGK